MPIAGAAHSRLRYLQCRHGHTDPAARASALEHSLEFAGALSFSGAKPAYRELSTQAQYNRCASTPTAEGQSNVLSGIQCSALPEITFHLIRFRFPFRRSRTTATVLRCSEMVRVPDLNLVSKLAPSSRSRVEVCKAPKTSPSCIFRSKVIRTVSGELIDPSFVQALPKTVRNASILSVRSDSA